MKTCSDSPRLSFWSASAVCWALLAAQAQDAAEEHAFEWGGIYDFPEGMIELVIQPGPDASIDIAFLPVADASEEAFDAAVEAADLIFTAAAQPIHPGEELTPGQQFWQLRVDLGTEMRFPVRLPAAGHYVLFTQHFADEFQTTFVKDDKKFFTVSSRNVVERFGQIVILPAALEAFGVTLAPVTLHRLVPSFTAPARVAYDTERMAHVGSAVAGRVVEIPVRLGDTVNAGDLLAVVESPELGAAQSDYLQKLTLAESSTPLMEVARNSYERARKLYDEKQSLSLTEVQRRQSELLAAEAAVRNARAALLDAANRLKLLGMKEAEIQTLARTSTIVSRHLVLAPIAGRIIQREVTLGEIVRPDQEALLVLADMTKLWVLVEVPESRLQDVALGAAVRIDLAAYPDAAATGTVSFISPALDPTTRTAQVRVEVANADGILLPGMFAQAVITAIERSAKEAGLTAVLAVPDSAIQMIEGRSVVFVPLADHPNTFLKRPVTVGAAVNGMLPVLYGLREGELIVLTGSFIFKAELGKSSAKHEH